MGDGHCRESRWGDGHCEELPSSDHPGRCAGTPPAAQFVTTRVFPAQGSVVHVGVSHGFQEVTE